VLEATMYTVELVGSTPEADTAALITLIRDFSSMSLAASTREVDILMSGGAISLVFDKLHDARVFASEAEALGAVVYEGAV
jgi:hypothetical protein